MISISRIMNGMITILKEDLLVEGDNKNERCLYWTGKPVLIICIRLMDKDVSNHGQNKLAIWRQYYLAVTPIRRNEKRMQY